MLIGREQYARTWLDGTVTESRRLGEPLIEMAALLALAQLDLAAGDIPGARIQSWAALALADRAQSMAARVKCVAVPGEILAHDDSLDDGVALMRRAIAQPTFERLERDITECRLAGLVAGRGGAVAASRDLPAETPLATVLAIAAARAD